MTRTLLIVLALATTTPVLAATSAPVWTDDGGLRLADNVLGTWCLAPKAIQQRDKSSAFYQRSQDCYKRGNWIVLGPNHLKADAYNKECDAIKIERAQYDKWVVVTYNCEQDVPQGSRSPYGPGGGERRSGSERVEIGLTSDDYLFITPVK